MIQNCTARKAKKDLAVASAVSTTTAPMRMIEIITTQAEVMLWILPSSTTRFALWLLESRT